MMRSFAKDEEHLAERAENTEGKEESVFCFILDITGKMELVIQHIGILLFQQYNFYIFQNFSFLRIIEYSQFGLQSSLINRPYLID